MSRFRRQKMAEAEHLGEETVEIKNPLINLIRQAVNVRTMWILLLVGGFNGYTVIPIIVAIYGCMMGL